VRRIRMRRCGLEGKARLFLFRYPRPPSPSPSRPFPGTQGLTALHMRSAIGLVAACKPRRANVLVAAALTLRTTRLMRVNVVL